jgi:hypothetical protein
MAKYETVILLSLSARKMKDIAQVTKELPVTIRDEYGPGSSVGMATGYGLDGPGIESRWGRDFSHTSRPALGPTQPPVQWVPGISRGKAAGAWCWPPTPSRRRGREWVGLYLYYPGGPFVACYRVSFTFYKGWIKFKADNNGHFLGYFTILIQPHTLYSCE